MSLFQVLICVLILVLCFRSASVEILFAYYVCAVMALVCEVLVSGSLKWCFKYLAAQALGGNECTEY